MRGSRLCFGIRHQKNKCSFLADFWFAIECVDYPNLLSSKPLQLGDWTLFSRGAEIFLKTFQHF